MCTKPWVKASLMIVFLVQFRVLWADDYDPLVITKSDLSAPRDFEFQDETRKRVIPLRVFLPSKDEIAPVILFSHGLGGSRRACGYLGTHWSARGYAVVFIQHAGSDESVWKETPIRKRRSALKEAASPKSTVDRFLDVSSVLNQLAEWNAVEGHPLNGKLDLSQVGMSGHSYGAATTQGVSGQSAPLIGQKYTDERIDAALMLSPNRPKRTSPKTAFGDVKIPWMLMTGTKDTSPINDTDVSDRRQVYPGLPASINAYELVLFEAEHSAFGDSRQARQRSRNPNHHRVILALSTAFWDAHLNQDASATKWLHGSGPQGVLEHEDAWQFQIGQP